MEQLLANIDITKIILALIFVGAALIAINIHIDKSNKQSIKSGSDSQNIQLSNINFGEKNE